MRKRAFTLLEITLCLALLMGMTSLLGWKIKESIDFYRFQNSTHILTREIEKLQLLSMAFGSDMQLSFSRKSSNQWEALTHIHEAKLHALNNRSIPLPGIESIKGAEILNFFPSGKIEPATVVTVTTGKWTHLLL